MEQDFVDAVDRNLSRGRIVVLLVGEGIRAETERLVEALQLHAGFHFTLALFELAIFRMSGGESFLVQPRTLTRTTMIERGIVRVEDGRIKIAAAPVTEITGQPAMGSISAEQFFEVMAARDPRVPAKLREFLVRLETLGVYTDLQRSLSLKWDDADGVINLGYIMRDGQIWTEDVFDARSVSFVAVTQQFNTTSSMGRLTLNVLLSFAQFERELSSERVRDKVAASRAKGKWTGGTEPLGYEAKDKKLVVNEAEAATVRTIFELYLKLQGFQALIAELDKRRIVTKRRQTKLKKYQGGIPFTYGPLAYLLKNRVYLGEMGYRGKWYPG